jgi:hypothetical protein
LQLLQWHVVQSTLEFLFWRFCGGFHTKTSDSLTEMVASRTKALVLNCIFIESIQIDSKAKVRFWIMMTAGPQKKENVAFLGCCYVLVYYSKLMKISALIRIGMRSFMDFINVLEIECPATSSFTAPPWPSGRARKIKNGQDTMASTFSAVTLNSTSFVAILLFFFWYL